jgi:hypothetical protein
MINCESSFEGGKVCKGPDIWRSATNAYFFEQIGDQQCYVWRVTDLWVFVGAIVLCTTVPLNGTDLVTIQVAMDTRGISTLNYNSLPHVRFDQRLVNFSSKSKRGVC